MVTRGRIKWDKTREHPYEILIEDVDQEEINRLGAKTRTLIKEYNGNSYLKVISGNVTIVYTTEKGEPKEDKGE
jgi:hypothetical protein